MSQFGKATAFWSGISKPRHRRGQIVKGRSLPIDNECTNRLSNWKGGVNEKGIAKRGLELSLMLLSAGWLGLARGEQFFRIGMFLTDCHPDRSFSYPGG